MAASTICGSPKMKGKTVVQTYRNVAIEQMIATVEVSSLFDKAKLEWLA